MTRCILLTAIAITALAGPLAATPLERGNYLVNTIMACGSCHTPIGPDGFETSKALSGRLVDQNPAFTAIAPNITPSGEIGGWSDAELSKAIREGLRPDGSLIGPPMPFEVYRNLSDEDLAAVVAYLRSVPAVDNDPGTSVYKIPLPPAYGPAVDHVPPVPQGVTLEYGEYLAGPLGHCIVCHTKFDDQNRPQFDTMLGSGGNQFPGPWGVVTSANITPVGLSGYTDEQLIGVITTGMRPDGTALKGPMAFSFYANMTADDLNALVAYLRSLPAVAKP